jgi:hypothetical protein
MISQKYFQIIPPVQVHLKTDKVDLKKKAIANKFFFAFFFNPLNKKKMVECPREFFAYFNALETRGDFLLFPVKNTQSLSLKNGLIKK